MANKSNKMTQRMHRPGEGALVDVIRPSGVQSHVTPFATNLTMAPVPERRYSADVASVVADENIVQLLFGQKKVGATGLRSMLAVHMNFDAVHQFLTSLEPTEEAVKTLERQLPKGKLTEVTEEPQQTVAVVANVIIAGYSGSECCLDCYHASPFSLHNVQTGASKIALEPVVRISLPTATFLAMKEKLRELAPHLPSLALG